MEAALGLPCLAGARLVAGGRGMARRVRVVNIMEVPDIVRWMRGGELLLTTAYPIRDDPSALVRLIPELADRGLAGLGIRIGPYLDALPTEMISAADNLDFPVIEIPPGVVFNDILVEVLGTILNRQAVELERSQAIHERLTAVSLAGGSRQQLLAALAELIHLPVAIVDAHGDVVVTAGDPPVDERPPDVTRSIKSGGSKHGEIVAWTGDDPAQLHQLRAIEQAATVAAMAVAQERAVVSREQRHRTLLLMELVSGRPLDRAEMARRADAMGWNFEGPRVAVLVEIADATGSIRVADQVAEERLVRIAHEVAGQHAIIWALPTGLAMLAVPGRSLTGLCHALRDRLGKARAGLRVMVAFGRPYADLSDFHHSYHEAVEALALGREVYGSDFVLGHDEIGVYRLLYQIPPEELRRYVAEALEPLMDYDNRRNGRLLETLECYFRHDRNRVTTAADMNVHYNTLRYRLERIERLIGGIDRHPMSRLQLEMAVHAHRVLAARAGA